MVSPGSPCIGNLLIGVVEMLQERDKPLDFSVGQEEFAKNSSGRLMAKFLLSFL